MSRVQTLGIGGGGEGGGRGGGGGEGEGCKGEKAVSSNQHSLTARYGPEKKGTTVPFQGPKELDANWVKYSSLIKNEPPRDMVHSDVCNSGVMMIMKN